MQRSFIKNVKERKERNILFIKNAKERENARSFNRTDAQPWSIQGETSRVGGSQDHYIYLLCSYKFVHPADVIQSVRGMGQARAFSLMV